MLWIHIAQQSQLSICLVNYLDFSNSTSFEFTLSHYVVHSPCITPKSSPSLHGSLNKSLSFFVWCLLPNLYYLQHAVLFIKSYPFFNALTKIYPTSLEQTHLSSSHLTSSYYPCNTSQVSIFPLYGPLAFHGCLILFNLITNSLISGYAHFWDALLGYSKEQSREKNPFPQVRNTFLW